MRITREGVVGTACCIKQNADSVTVPLLMLKHFVAAALGGGLRKIVTSGEPMYAHAMWALVLFAPFLLPGSGLAIQQ